MKKKLLIFITSVTLLFGIVGLALAVNPIKIIVNGKQIYSDVAPFISNGRTVVPLRVIGEALNANVEWDNNTKTVNITTKTLKIINEDLNNLKVLSTVHKINIQNHLEVDSIYKAKALFAAALASIGNNDFQGAINNLNTAKNHLANAKDYEDYTQRLIYSFEYPDSTITALQQDLNNIVDLREKYSVIVDDLMSNATVKNAIQQGIKIVSLNDRLTTYDNNLNQAVTESSQGILNYLSNTRSW